MAAHCDGIVDCADQSDEASCGQPLIWCSHTCIMHAYIYQVFPLALRNFIARLVIHVLMLHLCVMGILIAPIIQMNNDVVGNVVS